MQRVPSCGYCYKPYAFKGSGRPVGQRIPRLLSCGHTFCDGCVSKLTELQSGGIVCPTCTERTPLPDGKRQIKDMPTNLYILGILINNVRASLEKDVTKGELSDFNLDEGFNFKFPNNSETSAGAVGEENQTFCEECCTNIATCECHKCTAFYCKACFTVVHSSSRTLRQHEESPINRSQLTESTRCPTHPEKEIEFFDKTSEKLVCSLCLVTPEHKEHEVVPISEMCGGFKLKMEKEIKEIMKVNDRLQKSRGRLSRLFPGIKAECGVEVQQIKEHFQDLHTKLQAREVCLIREVKMAYCNEDAFGFKNVANEIIEKEKELEVLISESTKLWSSPSAIIKDGDDFLSKLSTAKDMSCVLVQSPQESPIKVTYPSQFELDLKSYGAVVSENSGLQLKKLSEEPAETIPNDNRVFTPSSEMTEELVEEMPTSPQSGGMLMNLPLRQNLVYVTHIKSPCDFMVQHAADTERLENLMDAINQYCIGAKALSDMVKSTEIGDMVCAQYSKDRYWYRARVIGEQQQPTASKRVREQVPKVDVFFIDYGNTEIVPLNWLRKIRPEFTDIPELAVNCSLVDIVPPSQCETWPSQSVKAFGSLSREKGLLMSVIKKSPGKLYVDLKSPEEEPTKDDDKPASVRDALVFLDVARFISPASDANAKTFLPVRSYKKPLAPQEGETLEVMVACVENAGELYVNVEDEKVFADATKIVSQMSSMYSANKGSQWRIVWPYKGLVCGARFSGDKVWYRALVTRVVDDQYVHVTYVDFGNSEELPFTEIRRIPDHMLQLPMQALQCSLFGIKPLNEEEGWTEGSDIFLSGTCDLKRFKMKVVEAEEVMPLSVILYQMDVFQPTSVNHLLVQNMHASVTDSVELEILQSEQSPDGEKLSSLGESSPEVKDWSLCQTQVDVSEEAPQFKQILFQQKLQYKTVEYPTETKFQFAVTYVDQDCTIFGYQAENSDHSLPELMKLVQKVCSSGGGSTVTQDQLSLNQPCCAAFSEDSLWYRAEIVGFPSHSTALVDYVDFGNREEIPLTSVKLDAAFLDIPKQSLAVELEGLPQSPEVQATVSKYLTRLLIGQTCIAIIEKNFRHQNLLKCVQLTLPDGSDALQIAKQMMIEDRANRKQPKSRIGVLSVKSPDMMLIPDTLIPEMGIAFDVIVTQVDTPDTVFLQRITPTAGDPGYADNLDPTLHITKDHLNQLSHISEKINTPDYFKVIPAVKNVWVGMLCCARYTQDDMWYRAQITEVDEQSQVRVLYIDYGTSEFLSVDQLKSFPGELLSLPKQAFRCCVVGLDGSAGQENPDKTAKAVYILINAVAGKKLICEVSEFGSPVTVELYERVINAESYEDVPLSQRLSELEIMQDMDDLDMDDEKQEKSEDGGENEDSGMTTGANNGRENENNSMKTECDDSVKIENEESKTEKSYQQEEKPSDDLELDEFQQEIQIIPAQSVLPSRPQLITPAQFCLKKDAGKASQNGSESKMKNTSEVD